SARTQAEQILKRMSPRWFLVVSNPIYKMSYSYKSIRLYTYYAISASQRTAGPQPFAATGLTAIESSWKLPMRISSRRGTIVFFIILGIGLVALAVALNVGWIILNWREGVLLFFGIVFFALLIAGMVVNTSFLVRELRRSEQHDSFINAVTHELKTPVASIRLHLETLQRREVAERQKQEFYRLMLSDTDRLTETVEQVLRAGRAGDKRAGREKVAVDFRQLVRECMDAARPRHHLPLAALRYEEESINGSAVRVL